MKKKDFICGALLLGAMVALIYARRDIALSKSGIMKEVYSRYNFDIIQINMKASNKINDEFLTFENQKSIIEDVFGTLSINGEIVYEEEETDFFRKIVAKRNAKDSQTTVIVFSEKDMEEKTTIQIEISIFKNSEEKEKIQNVIREIFKKYDVNSNLNVTMVGTINGKMEKDLQKGMAKNIMTSIRGDIKNQYENDRMYSLYGYTNLINEEEIIAGNEETNIHLAFRYNESENKTYLYMASPIISFDY